MKVGDLIKVTSCEGGHGCGCFFCYNESTGIGIVLTHLNEEGVKHSDGYWSAIFDVGEWRIYGTEAEVINESR